MKIIHIGRVPDLIDEGFAGEIICTHGTKALLLQMLRDTMSFSDRTDRRAIVEGRTPAKAAIHRLAGYSAHADQQTLCDWVGAMPEPPGKIRLVHGEPAAQKALKSELDTLRFLSINCGPLPTLPVDKPDRS